jgi:threonine aldolase
MQRMIDFRSDTVTRPTPAMRDAMMDAAVGDDVFGDDPAINALQERLAALLGYEAALFMPSGTQSNLCALMAHCQRGDEYLVGQYAHTYRWEAGGAAVLGSIQPQPLEQEPDGTIELARLQAAVKPDDPHFARTRLLTLENTWNGKVLPMDYLSKASDLARSHGIATHLDGARLFNAATEIAAVRKITVFEAAKAITQPFDSVSVCFSKGLGAPVGSVLCGDAAFIHRARRLRKMAGGAMRQAGYLAAAAHYALDHHIERLAEDHQLASRLAKGLSDLPEISVDAPQTNMVFVELKGLQAPAQQAFLDSLKASGILSTGTYKLRFVTHLDTTVSDVDHAIATIRAYFQKH